MSDHIPLEMQEEIMKRLPTKSLMKFRSVSKPWKSLIDSPKFIAEYSFNQERMLVSYLVPATRNQRLISVVDDDTLPQQELSLPVPLTGLSMARVVGSSQGLFALYSISAHPNKSGRMINTFVIWNPSIRKSVAIDVVDDMVDPFSHIVFGFGVCPHTSDPNIVRIDSSYGLNNVNTMSFIPWKVEVYTLSSGAWKSIPAINQPRHSIHLLWEQVVINEIIYWLAINRSRPGLAPLESQGYNLIVSYDMTSERFMEISLPESVRHASYHDVVISKLKESLVVVEVVHEADQKVYDVWMMEHGVVPNSFAKVFSVDSPDASIEAVLGFWKFNEPIFAMRTDYDADEVFVHRLHSEHINYIGISGNAASHRACPYVETLLLLDR